MFLESLELYRVDVQMYLRGNGWHCYTLEHGVVNLGVSGINRPQKRCIVRARRKVSLCTFLHDHGEVGPFAPRTTWHGNLPNRNGLSSPT